MTGNAETVRFESPGELGRHLYDRGVRAGDTGRVRLRLALLSGVYARRLWQEHADS